MNATGVRILVSSNEVQDPQVSLIHDGWVRVWILYGRGRVGAQQLSSAKGHYQFLFLWWPTQFFIVCLCIQMSGGKKATLECCSSSGHHC